MAQSVVLFSSMELLISVGKGKNWNLTPSAGLKLKAYTKNVMF